MVLPFGTPSLTLNPNLLTLGTPLKPQVDSFSETQVISGNVPTIQVLKGWFRFRIHDSGFRVLVMQGSRCISVIVLAGA